MFLFVMNIIDVVNELSSIITVGQSGISAIKTLKSRIPIKRDIEVHRRIFPMYRESIVVTTGQLKTKEDLDPEDKVAALALLKCFYGILSRDNLTKITYLDSVPTIRAWKHIIAIGGPFSNPLTKHIALICSSSKPLKPVFPLYLFLDPQNKVEVVRKFNGKERIRPMWTIIDTQARKHYFPEMDKDGWLERDYLLLTIHPIDKEEKSLFVAIMGLYGPGVRATDLLLSNKNGVLDIVDKSRNNSPYFQSLLSVEEIDHKGDFSIAKKIQHVVSYPLYF